MDFETISRHIAYDPNSGKFTRLSWAAPLAPAGEIVFNRAWGPLLIMVEKRRYMAGHIAWMLLHRRWPIQDVCYKNGDLSDFRAENLFEATHSQAGLRRIVQINNSSGVKGVSFHQRDGVWQAFITVDRKRKHLGSSPDKDAAIRMRRDAEARFTPYAY